MALCVAISPDGSVYATGAPVEECTSYVLLAPGEAVAASTLNDWLTPPEPGVLEAAFVGVFAFVLGCFIVGRLVGHVVTIFDRS